MFLEKIASNKADFSYDIPVNLLFIQAGDYSSYSYMIDYSLATALPQKLPPLRNVLYPLDNVTWIMFAVSILAMSVAFYILVIGVKEVGLMQKYSLYKMDEAETFLFQNASIFNVAIMMPVAIVCQEYHQDLPDTRGLPIGKSLRMLWVITSMLIIMSYSGNLKVRH